MSLIPLDNIPYPRSLKQYLFNAVKRVSYSSIFFSILRLLLDKFLKLALPFKVCSPVNTVYNGNGNAISASVKILWKKNGVVVDIEWVSYKLHNFVKIGWKECIFIHKTILKVLVDARSVAAR